MARGGRGVAFLVLLLLGLGASSASRDALRSDMSGDSAEGAAWRDLVLGDLKETLKGSGGSLYAWDTDHKILQDTATQAGLMRLEPQGLLLPTYTNANQLHYVVRGSGKMGLVTPLGVAAGVHSLASGRLIAQPQGFVRWVWNNGTEPLEIISVSDTLHATATEGARAATAELKRFFLAGAKKGDNAGMLNGFSTRVLAQAWAVKEEEVTALLEGQQESALIKVKEPAEVAAINSQLAAINSQATAIESAQREQAKATKAVKAGVSSQASAVSSQAASAVSSQAASALSSQDAAIVSQARAFSADFAFDLEAPQKDYEDPGAGWVSSAVSWNSRIMRKLGLAAARVSLQPNAMSAPSYVANTAMLYYAIKGEATVEVVDSKGQTALRRAIEAGDALVIPAGYARATVASAAGYEAVSFSQETSRPSVGRMAGRNAVTRAIPSSVQRAAFAVKVEVLGGIAQQRQEEYVLLRPAGAEPAPKAARLGAKFFAYAVDDPLHEENVVWGT